MTVSARMHGRPSTRNIKQVSVGYEEIPNRERYRLALLLLYVESQGKQKAVLNTDINPLAPEFFLISAHLYIKCE